MLSFQSSINFLHMSEQYKTPYDYFGESGVRQLVDAFYDVMDELPEAAEIRAMHGDDLGPMRKALTAYLTTWMGGPSIYLALKGSMCLTDAHAPFMIGSRARDLWLRCMDLALQKVAATEEIKNMLRTPFKRVAETVQNSDTDDHSTTRLIARG